MGPRKCPVQPALSFHELLLIISNDCPFISNIISIISNDYPFSGTNLILLPFSSVSSSFSIAACKLPSAQIKTNINSQSCFFN